MSCSTTKVVEKTIIRQIDSLVLRDSVIYVDIPRERIVDIVPVYDTLRMSTSVASASAWVDTSMHVLVGEVVNSTTPIETTIQYVDRWHLRDSIVIQEVPVEVIKEVSHYPKSYWYLLGCVILIAVIGAVKLYIKFKLK